MIYYHTLLCGKEETLIFDFGVGLVTPPDIILTGTAEEAFTLFDQESINLCHGKHKKSTNHKGRSI